MKNLKRGAWIIALAIIAMGPAFAQGGGKLKVTILVYSGRPNPSYVIDKPEDIAAIDALFRGGMAKGAAAGRQFLPKLGYNGLLVENVSNIASLPPRFYVCKGNIYMPQPAPGGDSASLGSAANRSMRSVASPQGALIDEGRSLESALLDFGAAEGKITPKAKGLMKE